jgi:hypothetical protein
MPADATIEVMGIRHHGPGSARSVVRALDALAPTVVLVELPADCEPALRWVAHEHLRPPVALLGHVVDHPHRAAFLPFATFSPEWQAFTWAATHGVPVRAIDLPLAMSLAAGSASEGEAGELVLADHPATRSPRSPRPRATPTPSAGGTTSSSIAATAVRRSPRSRRPCTRFAVVRHAHGRRRRCARRAARRTCASACAVPSPMATSASRWCVGHGTCRRSPASCLRRRSMPPPCAVCRR